MAEKSFKYVILGGGVSAVSMHTCISVYMHSFAFILLFLFTHTVIYNFWSEINLSIVCFSYAYIFGGKFQFNRLFILLSRVKKFLTSGIANKIIGSDFRE